MSRWNEIKPTWDKLNQVEEFSLSLPCVVINEDGAVLETSLSNLSYHLRISSALAHPLMKAFIKRAMEVGAEEAANEQLSSEDAEEFALLYDESKDDMDRDTLGTADDITKAVTAAKEGFNSTPRKILVIEVGSEEAQVLLVSPQI